MLPIPSYKYQLQQMGSHKYITSCTPSLPILVIGELAVSLFLVASNVCTSHFLVGNDLELFSKIASLNGEIFIKRRVPPWRGENFSAGGRFFKTLVANLCLSRESWTTDVQQTALREWTGERSRGRGLKEKVCEVKRSLMRACVLD